MRKLESLAKLVLFWPLLGWWIAIGTCFDLVDRALDWAEGD